MQKFMGLLVLVMGQHWSAADMNRHIDRIAPSSNYATSSPAQHRISCVFSQPLLLHVYCNYYGY